MKKIINPWRNHEGYNCFGCCPENPIGLHMEFYEDGDYIVSKWHPEKNYQGWVNTMHGGILSTLIDEVCGWVVTRKLQTSGYTVFYLFFLQNYDFFLIKQLNRILFCNFAPLSS